MTQINGLLPLMSECKEVMFMFLFLLEKALLSEMIISTLPHTASHYANWKKSKCEQNLTQIHISLYGATQNGGLVKMEMRCLKGIWNIKKVVTPKKKKLLHIKKSCYTYIDL